MTRKLYRYECFTGKCTTHKIQTKLHPGLEWRIFPILTSEDMDYFSDIRWCMIETSSGLPPKSSAIFGIFRKMLGNVRRLALGTILENPRKCSERDRKSPKNRQKHRHRYVYIIEKNIIR